ncbi:MAG: HAMP domain-containing methyl-accepting chemotaxis protein, partial [Acidihalobacter sp.]
MKILPRTIKAKLLGVIVFASVLVVTALVVSVTGQRAAMSNYQQGIMQSDFPLLSAVYVMKENGLLSGIAIRNKLLNHGITVSWAKTAEASIAKFDKAYQQAMALAPKGSEIRDQLGEIGTLWMRNKAQRLQALEMAQHGQYEQAQQVLMHDAHPDWRRIRINLQKVEATLSKQMRADDTVLHAKFENTIFWSAVLNILALVLGGGLVAFMVWMVVSRLNGVTLIMEDIAAGEGDLTQRMPLKGSRDELDQLGNAFNRFVERIQGLVGQVAGSTAQLAAAAEELSATSEDTNRHVREQQTETEQVAAAINEMSATVQEVAKNAGEAAGAAQQADAESKQGREVVEAAVAAIDALATEVDQAAQVIQGVNQDSEQIGRVLEVINGISEQTNLLALNAAIEAARAGEQGRGFAVVADEVRTLARRTQESTQEIREMIERLQEGAKNAVTAMESGRGRAGSSVEQARHAGQSLTEITDAVTRINDMNALIASAAEEQSAVAEEINRNVTTISQATDQTAAGSQQTAAASEQLARL